MGQPDGKHREVTFVPKPLIFKRYGGYNDLVDERAFASGGACQWLGFRRDHPQGGSGGNLAAGRKRSSPASGEDSENKNPPGKDDVDVTGVERL